MPDSKESFADLMLRVRACTLCREHLPFPPKPVLRAQPSARILVVGQAPGTRVQKSGIPWSDPSGVRLRAWMNVSEKVFYDETRIAIIPMGFCYPGKGKSGDLPPRPECAPTWHPSLLEHLPKIELILLIGRYAQERYLAGALKNTLTETVKAYLEYGPRFIPLVHPSPRNQGWTKKNPWFESDVVPYLRQRMEALL